MDFRFLIICQSASARLDEPLITLHGVLNEMRGSATERTELAVVVGAILAPALAGKHLDLMAYVLDKSGKRQPIPGYAGTPLILPAALGPVVLPYSIALPTPHPGIYGFDLFDRDGAFGPPESHLATYRFGVSIEH